MAKKQNQPGPVGGADTPSGAAGADQAQAGVPGAADGTGQAAAPASDAQKPQGNQGKAAGDGQPSSSSGTGAGADQAGVSSGTSSGATSGSSSGASTGPSSPPGAGADPAVLLKKLLEGYLKTSTLQSDYQSLYRSLPAVVGIAAEIMKKKEAGDAALNQGLQTVEKVLEDARDKAEQLSRTMSEQQSALDQLLKDKASLSELLKATQQSAAKAPAEPRLGLEAAALADPKVAYQLNTLMGRFSSMISREVERKIAEMLQSGGAAAGKTPPKS